MLQAMFLRAFTFCAAVKHIAMILTCIWAPWMFLSMATQVRELESTVERLSVASPTNNGALHSPTTTSNHHYAHSSGGGGYDRYSFNGTFGRGLGAGSGGYLMSPSELMSSPSASDMGSPGIMSPAGSGSSSGDEHPRRHSSIAGGGGGNGGMPMSPLKSGAGFDCDDGSGDPWNFAGGTVEVIHIY